MPGSLFGSDAVFGEIFGQALDNGAFRALVGLGNQIDFVAFIVDIQRASEFFAEDFAGFLGNFDGGFEIVLVMGDGRRAGSADCGVAGAVSILAFEMFAST